jgi:hypothetical protein
MLQAFAAIFLILSVSFAHAESPATVAAQAQLVANLQTRDAQLDAQIRQLGNGRGGAAAVAGLGARAKILTDKIARMTQLSEELAEGRNDFDALRQQVAAEPVFTLKALANAGDDDVTWKGTRNLLGISVKKDTAKIVNPAKPGDAAFEYIGKYAVREINEWTIRDMVRDRQAHLIDVLRLIATLRMALDEDKRNLARVQELRQLQSTNSAALESARAKFATMQ